MTVSHADEDLLVHLGSVAAQADPVPNLVLALARLAWTTRALEAELLELVEQTTGVPVGVRSTALQPRVLTFEGADVALDVQVEHVDGHVRLVGQVLPFPLAGGAVAVEQPDGTVVTAPVDDLGGFRAVGLGQQLLRIRVDLEGRRAFTTPWFAS